MKTEQILKRYSLFRRNMGIPIDIKVISKFWDKEEYSQMNLKNIGEIKNSCVEEKTLIAREYVKYLLLFDWVKFIAISGSVASGFAKKKDDIDLFIQDFLRFTKEEPITEAEARKLYNKYPT